MRTKGSKGTRLADLARFRQGAYRLLALLLLPPAEERLAAVPEAARHLRRQRSWATSLAFFGAWDSFLHQAVRLEPSTMQDLRGAYTRLFGGGALQRPIPLCESGFRDPQGLDAGQWLAQVEAEYTVAGVRALSSGQAPDHAAVELEFVSVLCGREADGWDAGLVAEALEALARQKQFLDRHLCFWLPLLARAAAQDGHGLYARVTQAAWALAAHDADFAGALAGRMGREGKVL